MRIFLAHPLLLVAILAQCSSGFDYTKEHAAMQCCGKISNADFQACSYKALEQDLSEMIEWFHADSIDPANLNQTMKAKVTKDIEEMVKEDTDFLIQMEKCTTQGKDQTLCCLERGVCTKCAAVVCNGTLNMENYEKRDVAVSMQQFLDAIAFCDGQVAKLVECLIA